MDQWKCTVCGYMHDDGEDPPDMCPICGAPGSKFAVHDPEQDVNSIDGSGAADDEDEFYGEFDEP